MYLFSLSLGAYELTTVAIPFFNPNFITSKLYKFKIVYTSVVVLTLTQHYPGDLQ